MKNSRFVLPFVIASIAGTNAALGTVGNTLLNLQVSRDGTTWTNSLEFNPNDVGRRVLVRASVSWLANGGPSPIGFASLTWQPVISNVRDSETIAPFANAGNNLNGGGVDLDSTPLDGPYGRVRPFAATGPSGLNFYSIQRHTNGSGGAPATSYLRIARNDITNWAGVGPTSGTAAANNFNGAGGVACVQKGVGNVGSADPAFAYGTQDIVIFQFALDVGTLTPGEHRNLGVAAPLEGMSRNSTTGERKANWFTSSSDNFGDLEGAVVVNEAHINLVPSPASLTLLGLANVAFSSRRRFSPRR
jgi:hypothetical protein